jgi:NitT/TauT family transport system substrate-binding protein
MFILRKSIVAVAMAVSAVPAMAEVNEVKIAQQYGVAFLPLMVMEREQLIEKRAKAAGLGELKASWVKVAGPSIMNDGLITGSLQFAAQGAPSLITLWAKTKTNVGIKGVASMTTYPLYLNTRNASVKSVKDFSERDKIAIPSVKISTQAIMLQMAAAKEFGADNYAKLDPYTVGLSHPDGLLALMNNSGGVNAHFTSSPFHEQEMKIPGTRTLTTNYEILGGPATAVLISASSKFREANPKAYKVFLDALTAAKVYLDQAKDTKSSMDDIYQVISNPDYRYTLAPEKVYKTAEFMYKIGSIKEKPASWKDLFFPEIHHLVGD